VLIVSDVHGAFEPLGFSPGPETLLVLGDLVNLMDYRTGEGITADILGASSPAGGAGAGGWATSAGCGRCGREAVSDDWESSGPGSSSRSVSTSRCATLEGTHGGERLRDLRQRRPSPQLKSSTFPRGGVSSTARWSNSRAGGWASSVAVSRRRCMPSGEVTDEEMRPSWRRSVRSTCCAHTCHRRCGRCTSTW
jgi:hypothetical protein